MAARSRPDPVAETLSEVLGGPLGARAAPDRRGLTGFGRAAAIAAVVGVVALLLAGIGLRAGCAGAAPVDGDQPLPPCYSALPAGHVELGGAEGLGPYDERTQERHGAAPEGALAGATLLRAGLSALTLALRAGDVDATARELAPGAEVGALPEVVDDVPTLLVLAGGVLALAWLALLLLLARAVPGRAWLAVPAALAPVLLLGAWVDLTLVGAVFAVAGLLLARDGRLVAGAVALGTAATLAWPVALVLLAVAIAAPAAASRRARAVGAGVAAWLAITVAAALAGGGIAGWRASVSAALDAPPAPGSLRGALAELSGSALAAYPLVAGVSVALAALVLALAVRPRASRADAARPALESVALLLLAIGSVLFGAGLSTAVMVLPFALLALAGRRDAPAAPLATAVLLVWQAVEVIAAVVVAWAGAGYLDSGSSGGEELVVLAALVRIIGVVGLAVAVVVLAAPSRTAQETTTRSNDVVV